MRWVERIAPGEWAIVKWRYLGETGWSRNPLTNLRLLHTMKTTLARNLIRYCRMNGIDLDICNAAEERWRRDRLFDFAVPVNWSIDWDDMRATAYTTNTNAIYTWRQ